METVRTPDERFSNLAEYPFTPNYIEVPAGDGDRLRMHYVDEGPRDGEVILCLHGQPTWSYLYRKMIPLLTAQGYRVIAPDLVGFGRSDKPTQRADYSYANHVGWLHGFLQELNLNRLTLVCQDWGGLLGLRLLTQNLERFVRVVAANTGLPDAKGVDPAMATPMRELFASIPVLDVGEMGAKMRENEQGAGFMYWIKYCDGHPDFVISDVMSLGGEPLPAELRAGYDAPFPDETFKQGARQFPSLVPIFPDDPAIADNRHAWEVLEQFDKPFLTAFSDSDPVTAGGEVRFQQSVPGSKGQAHPTIKNTGHFLQEESPAAFADAILDFCKANPLV